MTVTISQQMTSDKTAQLVQKAAQITALAAITNPNNSQVQALAQARVEQVIACLDARRLDPATLISSLSVNVNIDPAVGAAISATTGDAQRTWRIQAIQNALAKTPGLAATVLSTLS